VAKYKRMTENALKREAHAKSMIFELEENLQQLKVHVKHATEQARTHSSGMINY
jgi:hypothetical protein